MGRVASLPPAITQEFNIAQVNFSGDAYTVIAGWAGSVIGDKPVVEGHYNGKIDRPRIYVRALDAGARTTNGM